MKITKRFRRKYPKLSTWIELNIPKVKTKPKVWAAFKKYSELDESKALVAITPGTYPEVCFGTLSGANGYFKGSRFPNRVFLTNAICEKFEKTDSTNHQMHLLIESTLLHEMVHWGDHKDGIDQALIEEGKEFEKEAYGRDIGRYW